MARTSLALKVLITVGLLLGFAESDARGQTVLTIAELQEYLDRLVPDSPLIGSASSAPQAQGVVSSRRLFGHIDELTSRRVSGRAGKVGRPDPVQVEVRVVGSSSRQRGETDGRQTFAIDLRTPLRDGDIVALSVRHPRTGRYRVVHRAVFSGEANSRPTGGVALRGTRVTGWAHDLDDESRAVQVRLVYGGDVVAVQTADRYTWGREGHGFAFDTTELGLPPAGGRVVVQALDEDASRRAWVSIGAVTVPGTLEASFVMTLSPARIQATATEVAPVVDLVFSFSGQTPDRNPGVVCVRGPEGPAWIELSRVHEEGNTGYHDSWTRTGQYRFPWAFDRRYVGAYEFQARSTTGVVAACTLVVVPAPEPADGPHLVVTPSVVERRSGEERRQIHTFCVEGADPKRDPGIVLVANPCNGETLNLADVTAENGQAAGYWGGWDGCTFYITWDLSDTFLDGEYVFSVECTDGRTATGSFTINTVD